MASMASIAAELDTLPFSAQTSGSFPAGPPTDSSSHVASFTSTPPTTVSPDSMSLASEPDHAKSDDPIGGAHDIPLSLSLTNLGPLFEAAFPSLERAIEHQRDQLLAEEATPRPTPRPSPYLSPGVELDISSPLAPAIVVADDALPRPANENQGTDCHPAAPASSSRPRRARASLPVYNLALLSGIDAQKKRCAKGDINGSKRRKTLSSDMLASGNEADAHLLDETQDKPNRASRIDVDARLHGTPQSARKVRKEQAPPATITRRATRQSSSAPERLDTKLSSMGKRVRKTLEKGVTQVPRELKRLQDTKEYAHIDTVPVRYTVWSNGKYVDPKELEAKKKAEEEAKKERNPEAGALPASHSNKNDDDTVGAASGSQDAVPPHNNVAGDVDAAQAKKSRPVKKWLDKGLYAGQAFPDDISKGLTIPEKKSLAQHPELHQKPGVPVNKALPPPMFNGLRLLLHGRDFKLPFDICNPLPPGQPKPTQYRTITKNRFVGDASAIWKKTPVVEDYTSKCVCKPENGCDEDCQNRIMLYECDETNCNVGKARCSNRAFQDLQERTKKGGRYRVGVEVLKTADRGYGVRSNRCFEPNQIIMEYTGEIITEKECERRMNEVYKNNECYYLMSFDQNMIIDATTGSIARFVNHSCSPNCRMIKWVVSGQPRMALFAGDNPIMTGEELTYDYNFDPFSAKNVQKCLCGSPNCRGVLGPKPREVKPPREKKQLLKGTVKTGKRKLKELLEGDAVGEEGGKKSTPKKRKIATATKTIAKTVATAKGVKRSLTKTSAKVVKGTAAAVKRGASSLSIKTKHTKTTTKTKTTTTATVAVKTKPQVKCVTTVPQSGKPTDAKTTIDTSVTTQKKASAATSGKSGVLKMYGKKGGGKAVKAMVKSASTAAVNSSSAPVISPSTCSTIVAVGTDQVTAADLVKGGGNMAASSSTTPPKRGEKTTDPMAPVSASTRASISPARKRTPSRKLLEASSFLTTSAGKKPLGVTKKKSPASSMKKGLDLALALAKAQEQE